MTDTSFWTCPPDREVNGWGEYTITILQPPFPTSTGPSTRTTIADLAPHDPVRARRFAESFGTVDCVLEELPLTNSVASFPATRADLDVIRVGCWGNVIAISDPALADNGNMCPLLEETEALHQRYPDARIVGSVGVDMGENHSEDTIHLPGGVMLHYEGWDSTLRQLTGDPHAVLDALGLTPAALAGHDAELDDEEPAFTNWQAFGRLALGPYDPWGFETLPMSAFRVRHTEGYTSLMEEIWRFEA
ncbi:DUF6333 family protein [Kitasatospora sp. NPDC050543]|uniref:DUF6333 family protein n=1 Tax=Kitasatospora sp. NPDC050543 TaxID=3364054 RepID=UPI003791C05B